MQLPLMPCGFTGLQSLCMDVWEYHLLVQIKSMCTGCRDMHRCLAHLSASPPLTSKSYLGYMVAMTQSGFLCYCDNPSILKDDYYET